MCSIEKFDRFIKSQAMNRIFSMLYGRESQIKENQTKRYLKLIDSFKTHFDDTNTIHLFTTPGRTEIGGNHTDHNNGLVIAASVNLDSIAAAAKTEDERITLYSEGYDEPFVLSLNNLTPIKEEEGTTTSLIRGIAARLKHLGYAIGGFNAEVKSDVLVGSGLSSSASIEVLIATIFNELYNNGKISRLTMAKVGQYAENIYFGKPCGLMDQITCSVGGMVTIDFKDTTNPVVKKIEFDFAKQKYRLVVVNTGGGHADLTEEYGSIPEEMKRVAKRLGAETLRNTSLESILDHVAALRSEIGDRAILRAIHYFEDNRRVTKQVEALENNNFDRFLCLVNESGNSSFKWLQNCYRPQDSINQPIALALAITEHFIKNRQGGACRVHGGGFAGTIQAFIHENDIEEYRKIIERCFGKDSVKILRIRPKGTLYINKMIDHP